MRWISVVLLLVFAACSSKTASTEVASPVAGRSLFSSAPASFDRLLRSGGRPTVVNVWASWCIPCRHEAPLFRVAAKRYANQLRFLGVDTEDVRSEALDFIRRFQLPYASAFDPSADLMRHLKVLGVPTTFFFKASGELALTHNGEIHGNDLDSKIQMLLQASRSR